VGSAHTRQGLPALDPALGAHLEITMALAAQNLCPRTLNPAGIW